MDIWENVKGPLYMYLKIVTIYFLVAVTLHNELDAQQVNNIEKEFIWKMAI